MLVMYIWVMGTNYFLELTRLLLFHIILTVNVTYSGAMNLLLSAGKFAVGVICHSSALIADAGHSLSDLFSDFVTLWAVYVCLKYACDGPFGCFLFDLLSVVDYVGMKSFLDRSLLLTSSHSIFFSILAGKLDACHLMRIIRVRIILQWKETAVVSSSFLSTSLVFLLAPSTCFINSDGHGKFEAVGSLFLSLTLLGTGLGVGAVSNRKLLEIISLQRQGLLQQSSVVIPGFAAMFMAALSIVSKEWLYRITRTVGERLKSQVVIANAWHHRSDAYSVRFCFWGTTDSSVGEVSANFSFPLPSLFHWTIEHPGPRFDWLGPLCAGIGLCGRCCWFVCGGHDLHDRRGDSWGVYQATDRQQQRRIGAARDGAGGKEQ